MKLLWSLFVPITPNSHTFAAKASIRLQGAASDSRRGRGVFKKKKHVYEPGYFFKIQKILTPKHTWPQEFQIRDCGSILMTSVVNFKEFRFGIPWLCWKKCLKGVHSLRKIPYSAISAEVYEKTNHIPLQIITNSNQSNWTHYNFFLLRFKKISQHFWKRASLLFYWASLTDTSLLKEMINTYFIKNTELKFKSFKSITLKLLV